MIRLFLGLCKTFQLSNSKNDFGFSNQCSSSANISSFRCPKCYAKGDFNIVSSYSRSLICLSNGIPINQSITINRVKCFSCNSSHAILPFVIIPYSPFSFHFILSLIYDYFTHRYPNIASLCKAYDISVSTLYRIRDRFIQDKMRMLGLMKDAIIKAKDLIYQLINHYSYEMINTLLQDFFNATNSSFLQALCKLRLKRSPRKTNASGFS